MQRSNFDFAVIGAGALGLTAALELSAHGSVAVIAPGDWQFHQSASFAAGAMQGAYGELTADNAASPVARFCLEAQPEFRAWLQQVAADSGADLCINDGTFIIANARQRDDAANLAAIEAALKERSEPFERVDPKEVPGVDPHPSAFITGALHIKNEGSFDSRRLLAALVACNRSRAATLIDDSVVTLESMGAAAWRLHLGGGGKVEASAVIIAAGANSIRLAAPFIGELKSELLAPYAGQGTAIRVSNTVGIRHVVRTPNRGGACGVHAVPVADGALYVGATNRARLPEAVVAGPAAEEVHAILDSAIHELNIRLASAPVIALHSGLRPVLADNQPVAGSLGPAGLYAITGTHRTGILMAPRLCRLLVHEIQGGQAHPDNPFGLTAARLRKLQARDQSSMLGEMVAESLAEYLHPGGSLPYGRQARLERLLRFLAQRAAFHDPESEAMLQGVLNKFPAYAVPQLLNGMIE